MTQTDIARYAMWLFDHSASPHDKLPQLYDQLCRKNPLRSESFSFRDFEALFLQWRWRRLTDADTNDAQPQALAAVARERPCQTSPEVAEMAMFSGSSAPVSDYHVVTEMLIEKLIAVVNNYLAEGWTPIGGITRAVGGGGVSYWAQAMVKRQLN